MEEPPPVSESPPDAPQPPAMSLAARLLNVFAVPGEVFAVVKTGRLSVSNWVVPALLSALVGALSAIVIVSQPSLQKQMQDRINQQAQMLDQQVKAGKMKQADVDRSVALTRGIAQPAVLKAVGGMTAGAIGVAKVFWWAFILWILGRRFLRARIGYIKALEITGLALMISVLGAVVTLLLTLNVSKLFSAPSLSMVVADFDAYRKSPVLLAASNVFSLWFVAVLSVGLSKLAEVPFMRAVWLVFAAWIIQESFLMVVAGAVGQFAF